MKTAVLLDEGLRLAAQDLRLCFGKCLGRQVRVQPGQRLAKATEEEDVVVADPLRRRGIGADGLTMNRGVPKLGEPREGGFLDMAFANLGHARTRPGFRLSFV